MATDPEFRRLTREELDVALSWASREGWNPGLRDGDAFWAADPEGFYGMFLAGELIGTASIVSYGGRFGFVGLFIVQPDQRGKGLGTAFWNFFTHRLAERLDGDASAGLDGVFTMQDYYARGGFVFSHRNLRMEGVGEAGPSDPGLRELSDLSFDALMAYDAAHFGTTRPDFLRRWIAPEGGLGVAATAGDTISGYGVVRPCGRGCKIGPLFAENAEVAERIYRALSARAAGQPLFLDLPEINEEACALARRHGLKEVFGCARMVTGVAPRLPWSSIFGITTFELG